MARMIHLIRASAVASNVMQSASKGALSVPPAETLEILVYLAKNNKIYGQQARLTLASWDEASSKKAAGDPNTSKEVLEYLISPENLRPVLLPVLLENPAISGTSLVTLAESASPQTAEAMLKSPRVQSLLHVIEALKAKPELSILQSAAVAESSAPAKEEATLSKMATIADQGTGTLPAIPSGLTVGTHPDIPIDPDPAVEDAVQAYVTQNAQEISAAGDKPFQPLGGVLEQLPSSELSAMPAETVSVETAPVQSAATSAAAAPKKAPAMKKAHMGHEEERGSALQKISRLDIKGRIQLAMKGTKEERSILVRDGTKLVALAVLESPKITDGEVEQFAAQKNVLEAVLRQIPLKRRFVKNYIVVRNLVSNPRTPIDISLGLMKNILVTDLKNLAANKEVSDTIRKLALKMFKQKLDTTKKNSG